MFLGEVHEAQRESGIFALGRGEVGEDKFCSGPLETEELQGFDGVKIFGACEVEGLCNRLVGDGWPVERV